MGSKSRFLEKEVLDGIIGGTAIAVPATLYFALLTSLPSGSTDVCTEVSGGSYVRKSVTNNATNFPASTQSGVNPSQKTNGTDIAFVASTASWGTIVGFGIYDASSSGNLLYWGEVSPNKVIGSGTTFLILTGMLVITEE